jgi:uncharacterized membrane protein SpoIIM required for sporulation
MNRFLSIILLLIVLGVCVGFFRGWFSMTTNKELFSEKRDVQLTIDPDKMKHDANAVGDKTKALFSTENDGSQSLK